MNKKRIRQLATAIEMAEHVERYSTDVSVIEVIENNIGISLPDKFSLATYYTQSASCGTVGCIAGYCMGMFGAGTLVCSDGGSYADSIESRVADVLDIRPRAAGQLCRPEVPFGKYDQVTPTQAAQAVLNLLDPAIAAGRRRSRGIT